MQSIKKSVDRNKKDICSCGLIKTAISKFCKSCHHKNRITGYNGNCIVCNNYIWIFISNKKYGRGKYCSNNCRNIARRGVCFSQQHKNRISASLIGRTGTMLGIKRPEHSKDMLGSGNPNWHGGKSYELYTIGWNKTFKEQIRRRDNYKCFICLKPESECVRSLDVHHIDYNKKNINEKNLISLCVNCHVKTNFNREKWIAFFGASL